MSKFLEIEKEFRDEMANRVNDGGTEDYLDEADLNICCDEREEKLITIIKDEITKIEKFKDLTDKDIYRVLIHLYYSLVLNEEITDWLYISFLDNLLNNKVLGKKLFFEILTNSIEKTPILSLSMQFLFNNIHYTIPDNDTVQKKKDFFIKNAEDELKKLNEKLDGTNTNQVSNISRRDARAGREFTRQRPSPGGIQSFNDLPRGMFGGSKVRKTLKKSKISKKSLKHDKRDNDIKIMKVLKQKQIKYLPLATRELVEKRRKISHYAWWSFPTERKGMSEPNTKTYLTIDTALLFLKSPTKEWKNYLNEVVNIIKNDKKTIKDIFPYNDLGRIEGFINFFEDVINKQKHKSIWLKNILKIFRNNLK
tara:strand:- start:122 stop:1219 length:1098 start_codon:yes stop_codon:yes gene_type:complete